MIFVNLCCPLAETYTMVFQDIFVTNTMYIGRIPGIMTEHVHLKQHMAIIRCG